MAAGATWRRRLPALMQFARVVAASQAAGAYEPQMIPAHKAVDLAGRLTRLAAMRKATPVQGLAKREKGAPLSEAELEQRRDAARARWQTKRDFQVDAAQNFGGMGASLGAVGGLYQYVKGHADQHAAEMTGKHTVFQMVDEQKRARGLMRDLQGLKQNRKRTSKSKSVAVFDEAYQVVPKSEASLMRQLEASRDRWRKLDGIQRSAYKTYSKAKRVRPYIVPATIAASAGLAGLGAYLGWKSGESGLVARQHQFYIDKNERHWDRRIAAAREAQKQAPTGALAKSTSFDPALIFRPAEPITLQKWLGAAANVAAFALPMAAGTARGQRAMSWAGRKVLGAGQSVGRAFGGKSPRPRMQDGMRSGMSGFSKFRRNPARAAMALNRGIYNNRGSVLLGAGTAIGSYEADKAWRKATPKQRAQGNVRV